MLSCTSGGFYVDILSYVAADPYWLISEYMSVLGYMKDNLSYSACTWYLKIGISSCSLTECRNVINFYMLTLVLQPH